MNLIRRVSAIYKEQELPEYRGNPLIEALPEALTEDEVLLEMSYFPEIDEKIRWTAPANVREQYVERIKKFRCPQTNLIQAYKMILRALREGANKQVISSQADSLIKISRIWADF
ncbi:hypothetical protein P2R62_23255, partial [Escherichia coli]